MKGQEETREHPQTTIRRLRQQLANAERRQERWNSPAADAKHAARQDRFTETVTKLADAVESLIEEVAGLRRENRLLRNALENQVKAPVARHERDNTQPSADAEILYGVPAIARAIGLKTTQVYHLKSHGGLPTFKVGKTVCARRSTLVAWFNEKSREES